MGNALIDELWRRIAKEIPSKHLTDRLTIHAFGFRREFLVNQPKQYLEIGCRLGHSLAAALIASKAQAIVVDAWIANYAGEPNEGPSVVARHLRNLHIDPLRVNFRTGDSHVVLPTLLGLLFDMILLDGDHTMEGVWKDLTDVLPLLAPRGVLYFDDYESPLDAVVRTFAKENDLTIDMHSRHGVIPAWCTVRR